MSQDTLTTVKGERRASKAIKGGALSVTSGILGGFIVNPLVLAFFWDSDLSIDLYFTLLYLSLAIGTGAIVGGLFAMSKVNYGAAVAGGALAILSLWITGIPALLLVTRGKKEFSIQNYHWDKGPLLLLIVGLLWTVLMWSLSYLAEFHSPYVGPGILGLIVAVIAVLIHLLTRTKDEVQSIVDSKRLT